MTTSTAESSLAALSVATSDFVLASRPSTASVPVGEREGKGEGSSYSF
jgi:hypothetical protein